MNMMHKQRLIAIIGPTCSGKSAYAVELAKQIGGDIISADSRQVYKGLDIGTGKVTKKEMGGVRHYLLDVASPKRQFSAFDFDKKARSAIEQIVQRGRVPIICGGTGFYIDTLTGRIQIPQVKIDPALRAHLEGMETAKLVTLLKKRNPARAQSIDQHNRRRLIRAIEISFAKKQTTTQPFLSFETSFETYWVGLMPHKEVLRERITLRLHARLKRGMVREVQKLLKLKVSHKRLAALGLEYRFISDYVQKKTSKVDMVRLLDIAIWHYAKRQITYWRRNKDIHWFDPTDTKNATTEVTKWLTS